MPHLEGYFPIVLVLGLSGILGVVLTFLSIVLGPKAPSAIKSAPFECGSDPIGDARSPIAVKFYVVALLFIVFDVEVVFLYPWAVQFKNLGWFGYITMVVFVATVVVGLVYVWKKGALDWES